MDFLSQRTSELARIMHFHENHEIFLYQDVCADLFMIV